MKLQINFYKIKYLVKSKDMIERKLVGIYEKCNYLGGSLSLNTDERVTRNSKDTSFETKNTKKRPSINRNCEKL